MPYWFTYTDLHMQRISINHHGFFHKHRQVHDLAFGGLEDYTFYGFYAAYETSHSIGNRTQMFIMRTTDGGELNILMHQPIGR